MPLLVIFFSLWIGICFSQSVVVFALLFLLLLFISIKRLKKKGMILCLTFTALGFISFIFSSKWIYSFSSKENFAANGFVYEAKENYFLFHSQGGRYYVYSKDNNYNFGDFLNIEGTLKEYKSVIIESQFDFQNYLNKRGVYYQIVPKKICVNFSNPINIKQYKENIFSYYDEESKSLASSIMFNDRSDSEIVGNYSSLHLFRLISVSGLYLSFFLSIFKKGLNKLFKPKIGSLIAILLLSFIVFFALPRFVGVRILLFEIFKWVNKFLLKNKFDYISIVNILGILFLLINPFLAIQDSFILSFGFIYLFYFLRPIIYKKNRAKKALISGLFSLFFFIPFELSFFNSISFLSYLMSPIIFPIFLLFSLLCLFTMFSLPVYFFANKVGIFINFIGGKMVKSNIEIYVPSLNEYALLVYYIVLLAIILLLALKLKKVVKILSLLSSSLIAFYLSPIDNYFSAEISFINVGQGDATLIRNHFSTFLVDTGGLINLDVAKTSLIPYLKKNRIYSLDYIFITHHDFDHYGALDSLKSNFRVKNVIDNKYSFPITYQGITFTNYNTFSSISDDENDKSLVIGFNLANVNYLLMGDAPVEIEKKIINTYKNIPCDVLKVGHHGSYTSSSEEFIKYLKPQKAIISCGYNNKFKHPHEIVIKTLNKYDVTIYRTDLMGTIRFKKYFLSFT